VVLRNDIVLLFPPADLTVDVTDFDELSRRAVVEGEPATARAAIARYTGELLPDDRYEEWATERRELLRLRHLHLLRLAGQWMELSELDPCDEDAHLEVVRDHVAHGAHDAARSQYERMEHVLDRHLGVAPSCIAQDLRGEIDADAASGPTPVVEIAGHHRLSEGRVAALVAELTELTRRQAILLDTLTGAACGTSRLACVAVAS
jgi:DNA-binding SARP family transcriptional activator